ncbi:putative RNA polymerase Rpb7-like domain superfamily [Helianthus anomalus]
MFDKQNYVKFYIFNFIVAITGIENVGKGLTRDGTGFVTFLVKYQCVVFRPYKGEVLEAMVTMVNKDVYLINPR